MIDLTQSHDVLGAYHNIGFNGVRKEFTDPATNMLWMSWMRRYKLAIL